VWSHNLLIGRGRALQTVLVFLVKALKFLVTRQSRGVDCRVVLAQPEFKDLWSQLAIPFVLKSIKWLHSAAQVHSPLQPRNPYFAFENNPRCQVGPRRHFTDSKVPTKSHRLYMTKSARTQEAKQLVAFGHSHTQASNIIIGLHSWRSIPTSRSKST
jgi:hypothetical protein